MKIRPKPRSARWLAPPARHPSAGVPTRSFRPHLPARPPRPALSRILVPLDFSDHSCTALRWALGLAHQTSARLILLYVAETNPAGSEFGANHLPQLEADLRKIGRKQLARIKKAEIPSCVSCQSLIRAGKADDEIVDAAKALKADLIVMATHSQGSKQGQLGSTCERVARFAHCPILLVPAHPSPVPFFL